MATSDETQGELLETYVQMDTVISSQASSAATLDEEGSETIP